MRHEQFPFLNLPNHNFFYGMTLSVLVESTPSHHFEDVMIGKWWLRLACPSPTPLKVAGEYKKLLKKSLILSLCLSPCQTEMTTPSPPPGTKPHLFVHKFEWSERSDRSTLGLKLMLNDNKNKFTVPTTDFHMYKTRKYVINVCENFFFSISGSALIELLLLFN